MIKKTFILSILARDASYMIMVPHVVPDVPPMNSDPVVFYHYFPFLADE